MSSKHPYFIFKFVSLSLVFSKLSLIKLLHFHVPFKQGFKFLLKLFIYLLKILLSLSLDRFNLLIWISLFTKLLLNEHLIWNFKYDEFIFNIKIPLETGHWSMNEDVNFLLKGSNWSIHEAFVWINNFFNFRIDIFVVEIDLIASHVLSWIWELLELYCCEFFDKILEVAFILIQDSTSITNSCYLFNHKLIIHK